MGYAEEIMQIRQERAQRDQNEALGLIREKYAETVQARDQAAAQGDAETFEYYDREAETLEDEYQQIAPPPPPQAPTLSEETQRFVNKHQAFFRQPGAIAASKAAHALAVRAGLKIDTPEYFAWCSNALEMYGRDYNGVRFDPSEQVPTATEACKISGVTPQLYNQQQARMFQEGRSSAQQQQQQWNKKVG